MVYRRIVSALLLSSLAFYAHGQTIQSNTNFAVQNGTTVTTTQDIDIASGAALINSGNIEFKGNLNNSGERLIAGNLLANGSREQTIGGADSISFANLAVDNRAGVQLVSDVTMLSTLTLTRGVVTVGNDDVLYFGQDAASPVEQRDAYIHGKAVMNERPVGTEALSFLGVFISSGTDLGNVSLIRNTGSSAVQTIGTGSSIAGNWEIKTSEKNAEGHDVTFSWIDVYDNGLSPENMSLFGTLDFDEGRYVRLDNRVFGRSPMAYFATTGKRLYMRTQLDHIDREYTIANFLAQANTIEPNTITAFPNPATDHINLLLENYEPFKSHVLIRIGDATGRIFFKNTYPVNGNVIRIDDLAMLPQGVYRIFLNYGSTMEMVNFTKI